MTGSPRSAGWPVLAVLAAGIAAVQTPDGQPVAFVDRADDYRQPIKLD